MSTNLSIAPKKLGQLLVERGWITGEQLIRAIQSQRVVGGRIGTCLLEMDVLSEDKLLEALSSQLSVPSATIEELRAIGDNTLDLIPSKVASRWQAVPLSADRHDLRVATLNARNLACLDELEFCSNKRIVPHIANEVRIFEALERYYGVECPRRYGHLLDRLNRSRYMWDESAKILLGAGQAELNVSFPDLPEVEMERQESPPMEDAAPTVPEPADNPQEEAELIRPPASRSTLTLGGTVDSAQAPVTEMPVPEAPVAEAPANGTPGSNGGAITWPTPGMASQTATLGSDTTAPAPLTLDDVERLLAGQSDQKSIGRTVLHYLGQTFSRCALFSVRQDVVRGWMYHGESFDKDLFANTEVRLDQPSAFLGLIKGAEFFVGPLAPMPSHRQLAQSWGGELPHQCLMMPIRLRGRLISVLYADRGTRGLDGIQIDEIRDLAAKASIAFELCILRRKLRQKTAVRPALSPD